MQTAIYEGKNFNLMHYLETTSDMKAEMEILKKRADKGAFFCPYCNETLILKSGEVREEHFAHRHSKSCDISIASELYRKQVKRESKRHSVMKAVIYDELKAKERITKDFHVEYGYIKKASEKWRYYPDIIVNNKGRELAVTVLTDVTSNKDEKLTKQIKNRNRYFKNKNLKPIWFVEDREQSIDMDNRVIHLWEAEQDIAIKTAEDLLWEDTLNSLSLNQEVFELFQYHHSVAPSDYDVRSVYYVHSTETNIIFTVQRFIKDENKYPFRAFALNEAYQISLSTALLATQELQLSDPRIEKQQRKHFIQIVKQKEIEYKLNEQNKGQQFQVATNSYNNERQLNVEQPSLIIKKNNFFKRNQLNKEVPQIEKGDISKSILSYIQQSSLFSASEISEYLVVECGASPETFSTGRYRIYLDVCQFLENLIADGMIELVKKDSVNERIYKVV